MCWSGEIRSMHFLISAPYHYFIAVFKDHTYSFFRKIDKMQELAFTLKSIENVVKLNEEMKVL